VDEVGFHYRAFISYSHADAALAGRLHRALETYRVPAKLVGRETPVGIVPRRLTPIFKDREELAASADLSSGLKASLAASRFLIVIASPAAARSHWVNEEVRAFKAIHGEARVLVLIASGEPGGEADECFPPALRCHVAPDGALSGEPAEPLAADLRPHGDGWRLARLKLIAGLTGLRLDDLIRRDAQRRARQMRGIAIVASLIALMMSVLAIVAVRARAEAEHQRAQADGLVEFMLTDLRKKLEPVGRLDALDVVGQRALAYYAQQQPGSLDADALGRRARALHLVGEVRNLRGDSEGALVAFREAERTTAELLDRDPRNGQRIFDQAQSVFWVGLIAYQRGLTAEAERNFRAYKRLANELVAIDPKNTDWQMEVSYAESNLGTLQIDQGHFAEAEQSFTRALRVVEAALARQPHDPEAMIDVGQMLTWVGRAQEGQDHDDQAIATYRREVALYQQALARDPANAVARKAMIVARSSIALLEIDRGELGLALDAYRDATADGVAVLNLEPGNSECRIATIKAQIGYGDALRYAQRIAAAKEQLAAARKSLDQLIAKDPKKVEYRTWLSRADLLDAALLADQHRYAAALSSARQALDRLGTKPRLDVDAFMTIRGRAALLAGDMARATGDRPDAVRYWQMADQTITGNDADQSTRALVIRFAAARRLDRTVRAAAIARLLDARGFRHPFYRREQ
jgi:tetratricopeptide (TPR) repeat protein